jgi:hypothetical protein
MVIQACEFTTTGVKRGNSKQEFYRCGPQTKRPTDRTKFTHFNGDHGVNVQNELSSN